MSYPLYECYGTGDQVWFGDRYGKRVAIKVMTHDGLVWEEGVEGLTRLTGMDRLFHTAEVFCLRLIKKVFHY